MYPIESEINEKGIGRHRDREDESLRLREIKIRSNKDFERLTLHLICLSTYLIQMSNYSMVFYLYRHIGSDSNSLS